MIATMESQAIKLANPDSQSAKLYRTVFDQIDDAARGSELVLAGWDYWNQLADRNNQGTRPITGRILEFLVMDALWYHGIKPIYYQARITQIPHTVYDVFLYHRIAPISISCKASLGERWKQADLEGAALRSVYRGATNVLVTTHADGHKRQREVQERTIVGLDQVIVIEHGETSFDRFLSDVGERSLAMAEPVLPVVGKVLE